MLISHTQHNKKLNFGRINAITAIIHDTLADSREMKLRPAVGKIIDSDQNFKTWFSDFVFSWQNVFPFSLLFVNDQFCFMIYEYIVVLDSYLLDY